MRTVSLALVSTVLFLAGCDAPSPDDGGVPSGDAGRSRRDGGATGADAGPPLEIDAGPPTACGAGLEGEGDGTYYAATGAGACGFPAQSGGELLVAAMNAPQWDGSNPCGMCAHVIGPMGEVTVRIVDLCPECARGDLDLSPDAFDHIAMRAAGRVPITWTEVPCDVSGPLVHHFKDGSNQWWTALQIRNHRHRIASVEADEGGTWRSIPRLDYNYFVADWGLGPGPYSLRVTDVYGHVVEDTNVPGGLDDADAPSSGQLAPCE
ncbi:MAG: expansin EXLX1 family cellulose-binding protein [Sandaracinaceae bacterium]